jgi:PAP2 superfamily
MAATDELRGASAAPSPPAPGPRFPGWRILLLQVLLVAGAAVAYFGVRGLTQSALAEAAANARRLVEVETALGLDWETGLQSLVLGESALVTLANWVYIYGHWPIVVATLAVLFVMLPDRYYTLRNAMFISGAIGLVIFALVPVAPPRLGILDLVDTVTQRSSSYRTLQPPGLINRYAALPSLHFGWNLLVGIAIWQATRNPLVRALAVVMVAAMAFAVVATANHYVVDVLAGAVVALAGLAAAHALPALRPTPSWARPPE